MDTLLDTLHQTAFRLELEGLPLQWHLPPRRLRNPTTARPRPAWPRWNPTTPLPYTTGQENWLCAEFAWPETLMGCRLSGETGYIMIGCYCPFRLWIDGELAYEEKQTWAATGPIADPVEATIEPGRSHRLALCLEPTGTTTHFGGPGVRLIPVPCLERATDLLAIGAQLALAKALSTNDADRRAVASASACLDPEAIRRHRWSRVLPALEAAEAHLERFRERAKAHTVHLLGHNHIDMDWQWTWRDTVHCIRRDAKSAVEVLKDYPQVTMGMSQIPYYQVVKEKDPDLFRQIKTYLQEGRWENLAATWVEGDLNLADGEAIARQLQYAHDWSKRHLGATSTVFFAPDTFGHPANMPQLARLGGCDTYFHWRCNPGRHENWPARIWQGQDGTAILAISSAYGGSLGPGISMWQTFKNAVDSVRLGLTETHHIWGCGDHGGGLPRFQLARLARYRDRPAIPTLRFSTFAALHRSLVDGGQTLPRNRGETDSTLEGCYTTVGRVKTYNRTCECRLLDAEVFAALAGLRHQKRLARAWEGPLFSQFHDILCGCACPEAYEDAYAKAEASLAAAQRSTRAALRRIVGPERRGKHLVLANPLGFPREGLIQARLPQRVRALRAPDGKVYPVQHAAGGALAWVGDLAPFSFTPYAVAEAAAPAPALTVTETALHVVVETRHYRLAISRQSGIVASYQDRALDRELVAKGMPEPVLMNRNTRLDHGLNVFQLSDESPCSMPAWQINDVQRTEFLVRGATVRVTERGPVRACIEVVHRVRASTIRQSILCYAHTQRVEFDTRIDWRETGSSETGIPQLKVGFTTRMTAPRVQAEGPYSLTERAADGQEQASQRWLDVTGDAFGLTVFNDSRYGWDVLGPRVRLTLLRASYGPAPVSDAGEHRVRYAIQPHAADQGAAARVRAGLAFNRPPHTTWTDRPDTLPPPWLNQQGSRHVVVTALKEAEHSDDLLLRLFETRGRSATTTLTFPFTPRRCALVNFLEEQVDPAPRTRRGRTVRLRLRPYQVLTLRLKRHTKG